MDFLTVVKEVLAVAETAALIGALVFSGKGLRERQNKESRRSLLRQGGIYFAVYIVLNMIRLMYFGA